MGSKENVIVLGGSGAIGGHVLKELVKCGAYEKIHLVSRKRVQLSPDEDAKVSQSIIDFSTFSEETDAFKGYETAFYAIGVSSKEVSQDEYKKIELEQALLILETLYKSGVKDLHIVTSIFTGKHSLFFCGRVKAELEAEIGRIGFRRVCFYRSGGVVSGDGRGMMGEKSNKFWRIADYWKFITVEIDTLAKAIVTNSLIKDRKRGLEILENSDIHRLGKK